MEWYEKYDFNENPFENFKKKTIGYEDVLEEVFYAIMAGNMVFLEGEEGSGKTQLLREVIYQFGGQGKIIYVNCKLLDKELNVERLLKDKYGFLGKFLNKKPRNMILLLDNIEHLSKENAERIKYYYDQNYLRTVIFASFKKSKVGLHDSIDQRINKTIKLPKLSEYEAVQMVRERVGDDLLSDRTIKEIYRMSGKNNRNFLKNCEKVCSVVGDNKDLPEKEVKKIINSEEVMVAK